MNNYKLKIKEIRKSKNMSCLELANKIGVSQSYMSDLENQKYNIRVSRVLDISKALNVCPYKLSDVCSTCTIKKNKALFFHHYDGITVCGKPHNLYNNIWGDFMNEKTTVYIEPDLKEKVQIKLIRDKEKQSLSSLINEVLAKWLREEE